MNLLPRDFAASYEPRDRAMAEVFQRVLALDYPPDVALTAYAPGTNWPQVDLVTDHTDYGTDPGSVEARCHRVGEPYLIVDPSAPSLYPTQAIELNQEVSVPSATYAAIVYLDSSPPMNAVFW